MNEYDPNYVEQKVFARIGVKAIIKNSEGKFLLLRRSGKVARAGQWSFPGGGVDRGEDLTDAVKREAVEETGLEILEPKIFITKSAFRGEDFVVSIGYICAMKEGSEPVLNWEHDDMVWITKEEALLLDLTDDARFFVEQL